MQSFPNHPWDQHPRHDGQPRDHQHHRGIPSEAGGEKRRRLLLLASDKYFEDGGTPESNDDYGYAGLATVLNGRLQRVQSIRYDIQYRSLKISADGRAEVEAFLTGAFELQGEVGERYRKISDFHRFVLERAAGGGTAKWKFLSGM